MHRETCEFYQTKLTLILDQYAHGHVWVCVCVNTCVYVCGGQRLVLGVLLYCFSTSFLRGLSLNQDHQVARLARTARHLNLTVFHPNRTVAMTTCQRAQIVCGCHGSKLRSSCLHSWFSFGVLLHTIGSCKQLGSSLICFISTTISCLWRRGTPLNLISWTALQEQKDYPIQKLSSARDEKLLLISDHQSEWTLRGN